MKNVVLNERAVKLFQNKIVMFSSDSVIQLEFVLDAADKAEFLAALESTQCSAIRNNSYCQKMNSFNCATCKKS